MAGPPAGGAAMILPALLLAVAAAVPQAGPADGDRWRLEPDRPCIVWDVAGDPRLPHEDRVEMSGRRVSVVVRYGADADGGLVLERTVVWPRLRTIPDDTHASLIRRFGAEVDAGVRIDGREAPPERLREVRFDGLLRLKSSLGDGLELVRTLFPDPAAAAVHENLLLRNTGSAVVEVEVRHPGREETTPAAEGVFGAYQITVRGGEAPLHSLPPGGEVRWSMTIAAGAAAEEPPAGPADAPAAEDARRRFVAGLITNLGFDCPEREFAAAFDFAKIRAAESIFRTRGGLLHAPGGTRYYAAIWANDTIEYAGPFFPWLGDPGANEATWNALRHFARFTNPDYEPLPSSIIAEGRDTWAGAGDRGDAAMIAWGASQWAQALGDRAAAEEIWPLIEWCLEYCRRRTTPEGVVASDSDELEGRLPHGRTNLSTSCLTYAGLRAAARLGRSLGGGREEAAAAYEERAAALATAIEGFFGAEIDGFPTYRYHEEGEVLRSWICLPLVVGLRERAAGTLDALFSDRMWTEDGLRSIATDTTFWDRSTLYGLRGAYAAGDTARATRFFRAFLRRRLLGEHVPYAVEAWPEGDQRQLSAESALLGRVVTEGLFGLEPNGLDGFFCTPHLPAEWPRMALRAVHACGAEWDLEVERLPGGRLAVRVTAGGETVADRRIEEGATVAVRLPARLRRPPLVREPAPVDPPPPGARALSEREAAEAGQDWGTLRRGRSAGGRPLRIAGRVYARGIGTHAESEIPLHLDGAPAELRGLCGVDDEVGAGAPASIEFLVTDGESVLWRSGVMRAGDQARPFAVPLGGRRAVYLRATTTGDGNAYDHADWVELQLLPPTSGPATAAPTEVSTADFGAVPNDGRDDTAALRRAQAALRPAAAAGAEHLRLVLPPGVYDLDAAAAVGRRWFVSNHDNGPLKRVALALCGWRGLEIAGDGAELRCHGRLLPLALSDCEEVVVRGLAIDFARPHHSQGTVTAADADGFELAIGPEYPYLVEDGWPVFLGKGWRAPAWRWSWLEFEAGTGRIAWNSGDRSFAGRVEEPAPGRLRFTGADWRPAVGNRIVIRHGGRPHPGILVQRCRGVRFHEVVVHQAEGMGWLVQRSADVAIEGGGVRLRPGTERVFTTSADATHFSNCAGTIRVEKALFEGMMDDAINVHGTYLQAQGVEEGGAVRARFKHGQSTGFAFALPGDRVQFVRAATLLPYAEAEVTGVRRLSDTDLLLRLRGGPPAGLKAGDGLENLTATPEVVFRGNVVRNNRARGALFSSPRRTLVADNLFDHCSGSAVLLAGDCNGWFESGACRDVTIRGNRFVNNLTSLYQFTEAVIAICPEVRDLAAQDRPYHAGVRILDNDFTVFDAPVLYARSVAGLEFRGNRIERSDEYPPFHPNRAPAKLVGCRGAVVEGLATTEE
ncbi:MAG: hypothetical protein D6702_02085 [Planctomycetota bacterium]|nr:MAG: hypothetical protein D6702_02085 [Planctomycetota bacterium]